MTAPLYIDGIELTLPSAAELLVLAPDVPDAGEALDALSADATLSAIHQVLAAHHCDLGECSDDLWQRYVEDPGYTSARMSRCIVVAARLAGVSA